MGAIAGGCDALALGHAGVQAEGQNVHGANQQLPQSRAYEAAADADDGQPLGYAHQVDFRRHYAALGATGEGAAVRAGGTGVRLVRTATTSPLSAP